MYVPQKPDCLQVWQEFREQLNAQLDGMRYHDVLLGRADLNLEVHATNQGGVGGGEERLALLGALALNDALSLTRPDRATWQNSRRPQSRIDCLLYRAPRAQLVDVTGPEEVLDTDHRPVLISVSSLWGRTTKTPKPIKRRTGVASGALHACNSLAENLEIGAAELELVHLAGIVELNSVPLIRSRMRP